MVTSGGCAGTSGSRRRLAAVMIGSFAVILIMVTVGNAGSTLSDFAAAGVPETAMHVWIWEVSSIVAWACAMPAIWWAVARLWPPRAGWPVVAGAFVVGLPIASAWHIGAMIALRNLAYAMHGEAYRFQGGLAQPYLYEFRKDVATYLQFVAFAALCHWLLSRLDAPPAAAPTPPRFLEVADGARMHRLPVDEIDAVAAAGNYVELAWGGRTLLHRCTLAAVEAELGDGFVRIHRSRIARIDAIRSVETNQAGDFDVVLADGARLRGSRRYRAGLDAAL